MELKEAAYKTTELGLIPEDWSITTLSKVGSFSKGKGIKKDEVQTDGIPCVRYGELYTKYDNIITFFHSYISEEVAASSIQIKEGDILFAGSGETREEIGKCAAMLYADRVYAGGDIVVLRPNNFDSTFLGYLLNAPIIAKQKSVKGQGDAVVHIYSSGLANVKIPVPPPEEQKAIATALSDVDTLITHLDKLISKKKAIKQGAMQRLLKSPAQGGQRLPGFEGVWVEHSLTDLCWFQEGPGLRNWQFTNKGMKVINVTNLVNGYLDLDRTSRHISIEEFENMYRHFEIDEGDIVVASSGNSYCKTAVVRKSDLPLVMNTSVIRFKPKTLMNYDMLLIYLKSDLFKKQIDLLITGGAQPNFGPAHLEKIKLILPSPEEQKAIAGILTDMDKEIETIELKKSKYLRIKQGMMQELLTGKTRLV